jgi:uncharacterized protein with FMN-binding domain
MKRGLLIAGGTLGGLGAVMAITPPNLSTTSGLAIAGSSAMGVATAPSSTPVASTSATATQSASKAASTKAVATKAAIASASATSNSNSATVATDPTSAPMPTQVAAQNSVPTKTAIPTPVQTQTSKGVSGVFAGPAIFVNYGTVQVEITVKDGHITDATALQAPTGRNDRWTNMALPILKKQTLAAQSDAIQGASGASYTSFGWQKSLQGALAKAGL